MKPIPVFARAVANFTCLADCHTLGDMANCYLCGRKLESSDFQLRRKVRTGGSEHIRFGKDRAVSARTRYGMRIVCPLCAEKIDLARRQELLMENWKLIGALLLLLAVAIARWLNL